MISAQMSFDDTVINFRESHDYKSIDLTIENNTYDITQDIQVTKEQLAKIITALLTNEPNPVFKKLNLECFIQDLISS